MEQFAESVDRFLTFREFRILNGRGTISRDDAESKAKSEYAIYKQTQKYISDFDETTRKLQGGE